ncbi:MAG: dihydrofolate reductase family protein [Nocardioidaceae bacterium]
MRKLVYFVASTIDGFIADPSRADPSGTVFADGDHVEPLMREYPEMVPAHVRPMLGLGDADIRHFDTVLEGRVSYTMAVEQGVTNAYPHLRHYVFSRTLAELPDPRVELVAEDPVAKVEELKQQNGKGIWLCGGGSLAATLRDAIDEMHLKLNPVVIAAGTPLFNGDFHIDRYQLASTRCFDSGVVLLRYVRP